MPNLALRIISSALLIPPVVLLVIYAPPVWFIVFISALTFLGAWELAGFAVGRDFPLGRYLVPFLAAGLSTAVGLAGSHPAVLLLTIALLFPTSAVLLLLSLKGKDLKAAVNASAWAVTAALYLGAGLGFASLTLSTSPQGRYWVLLLAGATFVGDSSAYAVGKLLGKRKLAPRISPGKTWAGAWANLGGTVATVAVFRVLCFPDLSFLMLVVLAISLSFAVQLGDLAESFIKRGFEIKDSGSLIPGHGGVLDRIDALVFAAPVVFLFSVLS